MSNPTTTTPAQRITELERELATKQRVYPNWIRDDKLTQQTADHRMQVIQDLLEDYRHRYPQHEQGALFSPDQLPHIRYQPPANDRPRHAFD